MSVRRFVLAHLAHVLEEPWDELLGVVIDQWRRHVLEVEPLPALPGRVTFDLDRVELGLDVPASLVNEEVFEVQDALDHDPLELGLAEPTRDRDRLLSLTEEGARQMPLARIGRLVHRTLTQIDLHTPILLASESAFESRRTARDIGQCIEERLAEGLVVRNHVHDLRDERPTLATEIRQIDVLHLLTQDEPFFTGQWILCTHGGTPPYLRLVYPSTHCGLKR